MARSLLPDPDLSAFYKWVGKGGRNRRDATGDSQVPNSPVAASGDFMMDRLLADLVPRVSAASGLSLFLTYAYFRLYQIGDIILRKHTDRPACEVSSTLGLGYRVERPWRSGIEDPLGSSAVERDPGDGLVYRVVSACTGENPSLGRISGKCSSITSSRTILTPLGICRNALVLP